MMCRTSDHVLVMAAQAAIHEKLHDTRRPLPWMLAYTAMTNRRGFGAQ